MNIGLAFTRIFFLILSIFFMTTYTTSLPIGDLFTNAVIGVGIGLAFGLTLIAFDIFFKRFNLRSFNIVVVGIFIGYLMGKGLTLVLDAVLYISAASFILADQVIEIIKN